MSLSPESISFKFISRFSVFGSNFSWFLLSVSSHSWSLVSYHLHLHHSWLWTLSPTMIITWPIHPVQRYPPPFHPLQNILVLPKIGTSICPDSPALLASTSPHVWLTLQGHFPDPPHPMGHLSGFSQSNAHQPMTDQILTFLPSRPYHLSLSNHQPIPMANPDIQSTSPALWCRLHLGMFDQATI